MVDFGVHYLAADLVHFHPSDVSYAFACHLQGILNCVFDRVWGCADQLDLFVGVIRHGYTFMFDRA